MHTKTYLALLLASGLEMVVARPMAVNTARDNSIDQPVHALTKRAIPVWNAQLQRREVPQEHSHQKFIVIVNEFLQKNNPDGIVDAVFGLLGNAAASAGQGKISNTDCLQQATADQAFTNAKAAKDIDGQVGALIYRALERNTGAVGQASVACTAIKAVNPEIAAISQHQDPASQGAAATNKAIALELAFQISTVGGDPLDALDSGTFAPGQIGDPTAKGNTCDTLDDQEGCIFTQNLIVEDATEDEVRAFVASKGGATAAPPAAPPATAVATTAAAAATTTTAAAAAATDCGAEISSALGAISTSPATTTTTLAAAPPAATATDCAAEISAALSSLSATATATATAQATAAPTTAAPAAGGAVDLGSCKDATIIFADGLDGRKEKSFEPKDKTSFPHGSALGIKVITDFICQQLNDKCKAPKATIDACNAGAAAAQKATGQAAADAFNAAFGK